MVEMTYFLLVFSSVLTHITVFIISFIMEENKRRIVHFFSYCMNSQASQLKGRRWQELNKLTPDNANWL